MTDVLPPQHSPYPNGVGELVPPNVSGLPVRRRWGRVALGVGVFIVFIWGTLAVLMSAGDRRDVLVLAEDVGRFEEIGQNDLRVARVGVDASVETVSGSDLDDVVGRVAAVDLVEGAILSPDQVVAEGERVVSESEALVGARLKPGEFPPDGVHSGMDLLVVVRPSQTPSGEAEVTQVEGWLLGMGEPEENTGERSASLVVPRSSAAEVTAAAADGRVSLVLLEG